MSIPKNFPKSFEEARKCYKVYDIIVSGNIDTVEEILEEKYYEDMDLIEFIKQKFEVHNPEIFEIIENRFNNDEVSSIVNTYYSDIPNEEPPKTIIGIKYFGY